MERWLTSSFEYRESALIYKSSGVEIIQGIMRHAWSQAVVEEGAAFKMLHNSHDTDPDQPDQRSN